MTVKNIILLFILTVFISGCGTLSSTLAAKGTGSTRSYQIPFDKAWSEMPTMITLVGLTYVRDDIKERYMLAERGVTGWSWGEKVAIFFTPEEKSTVIEVVAKPVLYTNISSAYWTWPDVIFAELDKMWKQ